MAIERKLFGVLNGENIYEYTVTRGDLAVKILNYGGIVRSLTVKTEKGDVDIVAGYNTLADYERDTGTYFGSIIGRVANRIGGGKFTLNGKEYRLYKNDGDNNLHGGKVGFNRKIWQANILGNFALQLVYLSRDGEEGFPANLRVAVTYSVTERGGLMIEYFAESDGDTPVCLTNHSYFNLNGEGSGDILGHLLTINAEKITPVKGGLIPTGEFKSVAGTAFDFTAAKPIGKDIDADDEQIKICGGYDINYVRKDDGYGLVAEVTGDKTGVKMQVYSTEKGVQFYSGNFLKGEKGKSGEYIKRGAFCLETQSFPDAVNRKEFPSVILKAGEKYMSATEYVIKG